MTCPFTQKECSAECALYFANAQFGYNCSLKQIAVTLMSIQQAIPK